MIVTHGNSDVSALNATTGKTLWKFQAEGPVVFSPKVLNVVVYMSSDGDVGANDGHLYALDATTGSLKWTYLAQGAFPRALVVGDGVVAFMSDEGSATEMRIDVIDAITGTLKWSDHVPHAPNSNNPELFPIKDNRVLYTEVPTQYANDITLFARDAVTGTPKWKTAVGNLGVGHAVWTCVR